MQTADPRRHSPAAQRNAAPILTELQRLLPEHGLMLEIASGTGQHAAHFSAGLPGWQWQPSDMDANALPSIDAWCEGRDRVRSAMHLDVTSEPWPHALPARVDAVFCANMIHIAPWACTAALMRGAAERLAPQGLLITYGPYLEAGRPTASGNLAFDADLRARNADWGVRELGAVVAQAESAGLTLRERVEMPANNLLLVWVRRSNGGIDGAGTETHRSVA
jgi:hypothetical protein